MELQKPSNWIRLHIEFITGMASVITMVEFENPSREGTFYDLQREKRSEL